MGLKEIRTSRGLTQRDLADMIHMDHATVNRAELRAQSAKLATYVKLARVLNVTLADLFADGRTASETALLDAFRKLPAARRDDWVRMLRLAQADAAEVDPQTSETVDPSEPGLLQ
jgi:transcriptional regulator with XRE-family HTH domain